MPDGPQATVVIVNWNGAHLLPACLDALGAQRGVEFHTWVVDNASTDGSRELLAAAYPHVRVLANPDNRGFAGGNNTALREVRTPFAVLLNNDARPEPDWLGHLLAPFAGAGAGRLAAVTSKVVFAPRFLRVGLATPGFSPGGADPRELGLRVFSVEVDGTDVTEAVLWERLTWGPEGHGEGRFRWTRPGGELLVPVPEGGAHVLRLRWAAERDKTATLTWAGGGGDTATELPVGPRATWQEVGLPAGLPTVDVVNNVGSLLLAHGYGADRGYQQVDTGQFDAAEEVFALCGCAVALRTGIGHEVGWFDEDFFLYYEDTDLSWRLVSRGWTVRYEPTAVVRHIHSASTVEWSPTFVFHTDRNRLLMLTKNATATVALAEVLRYPLTTLSVALRAVRLAARSRTRPALRPHLLRLRVCASYLRLLPSMLARRRDLRRHAVTARRDIERRWVSTR